MLHTEDQFRLANKYGKRRSKTRLHGCGCCWDSCEGWGESGRRQSQKDRKDMKKDYVLFKSKPKVITSLYPRELKNIKVEMKNIQNVMSIRWSTRYNKNVVKKMNRLIKFVDTFYSCAGCYKHTNNIKICDLCNKGFMFAILMIGLKIKLFV